MSGNNKQSNTGCSSSTKSGCGCILFVVFGLVSIGTLASPDSDLLVLYSLCTLAGLILLLAGMWEVIAKQKHEKEYAKLLAEFKQDGMNEAVYEKIVLHLNSGKYQGQLNVATAPPVKIQRFNEVVSIRYYAILDRLRMTNSPALRSELLNVGRVLGELNPFSNEWSEQRLANDLSVLSPTVVNSSSSVSIATQVEKLGELYKKSVITQAEFERGKALFLGSPPDIAAQTLNVLDGLHKLKINGALSESEYNVKKWELLSGKNLNPK